VQVKLETRIPAGFLSGLTTMVPAVGGLNLEVRACVCVLTYLGQACHVCACEHVHDLM